jgi:hypothetical protein
MFSWKNGQIICFGGVKKSDFYEFLYFWLDRVELWILNRPKVLNSILFVSKWAHCVDIVRYSMFSWKNGQIICFGGVKKSDFYEFLYFWKKYVFLAQSLRAFVSAYSYRHIHGVKWSLWVSSRRLPKGFKKIWF